MLARQIEWLEKMHEKADLLVYGARDEARSLALIGDISLC